MRQAAKKHPNLLRILRSKINPIMKYGDERNMDGVFAVDMSFIVLVALLILLAIFKG